MSHIEKYTAGETADENSNVLWHVTALLAGIEAGLWLHYSVYRWQGEIVYVTAIGTFLAAVFLLRKVRYRAQGGRWWWRAAAVVVALLIGLVLSFIVMPVVIVS